MKTAIIQFDTVHGDLKRNIKEANRYLAEAGKLGAEIACFPELWNVGYVYGALDKFAEPLNGPTNIELAKSAKEYGMYIISPFLEVKNGKYYDSAAVIGPKGEIGGVYRKTHLAWAAKEHEYFARGERLPVFNTKFGKIGVAICYDFRFPEMHRYMMLAGIKALFLPMAAWTGIMPGYRERHVKILAQAISIFNQMYTVVCCRAGYEPGVGTYYGDSLIVDPMGEISIEASRYIPMLLVYNIDMGYVDEVRKKIPFLKDIKWIQPRADIEEYSV